MKSRIIVCFLFFLSAVFADEHNKITIFGNEASKPKIYLEDKVPKGLLIEIMKYVESKSEYSFDFKLYPWKRAYVNSTSSSGGVIGLSMNKERLKIFDYSDVVYYDTILLVTLKENRFEFNSMQDLKGKIIGLQRGASIGEEFEKSKNKLFKISLDNSGNSRLLKLLAGRIDVAIVNPGKAGFYNIINQDEYLKKNVDRFVILKKPIAMDPNYLGFSKKMNMKDFLVEFNSIIDYGYKSGELHKIIEDYSIQ